MSQVATPTDLNELLRHKRWLQEQLAENAKTYQLLHDKLQTLEEGSDEYATIEGELYAWAAQLGMDSDDVVKVMDDLLDALPDDDE